MTKKISVIFLYSTIVHYTTACINSLSKSDKVESIDVVHWDKKNINSSGYDIPKIQGIKFHKRSEMSHLDILKLIENRKPSIIYVSGWMDKDYLKAISIYKKNNKVRIVCGIDDQWKGTFRQHIGKYYFNFFYRHIFDFMWVSGKPQYHYAQRFGYPHEKIISNLLSGDSNIFSKKSSFTKRLVFLGRFVQIKGLDLLIDAYFQLPQETRSAWPLYLIGDGELTKQLEQIKSNDIHIIKFLQPNDLITELNKGGIAIMPSYHDQWGVAIHEMSMLGYPLILSSTCGAATEFLIPGFNGFLFKSGNAQSLLKALYKITKLSESEISKFRDNSLLLSKRITTEISSNSLLSVLELDNI